MRDLQRADEAMADAAVRAVGWRSNKPAAATRRDQI